MAEFFNPLLSPVPNIVATAKTKGIDLEAM